MSVAVAHPVAVPNKKTVAFEPPTTWRVVPLYHLFNSVGGATPSKDNDDYWKGDIPWVSPKDMKSSVVCDSIDHISQSALSETRLSLLPVGTVLIVVRGMILAHTIPVATTITKVTINQDMKGLSAKAGVRPDFLAYLLRAISPLLFSTIEESGHGTRCLRLDLWRNILVGVPLENEQDRILSFIDRKTAQIDAVVAKKQRLIERLQEKRQALISHAVTKGLDPHAPVKDSGIEWLGEIPAHWTAERLKFSITKIEQGWSPQCDNRPAEDGEWGVLKVGCVNRSEFDSNEQKALPEELAPLAQYEIGEGDILMSRGNTRELVGSAALVKAVRPKLLLCDLLYRFRSRPQKADSQFLVLQLRSPVVRYQIEREATGTSASMKKIGQETIRSFWIVLPPIEEQRRIVAHIAEQAEYIDKMTDRIRTQIAKLQEYRQTLISAAVTGKIDVAKEAAC